MPMSAETLFDIVSDVMKNLHLYMLPKEAKQDLRMFRGVGRFYCEGVKGLRYAARIEVLGGAQRSKLILAAYSESEASLVGFYHCILDEIEKRTDIKDHIETGTMIQHIQPGSVAPAEVPCPSCGGKVSTGYKTCPWCGNEI